MDEEQARELIKAFKMAQQGNWMPITIICAVFGLVFVLVGLIIKKYIDDQKKRNEKQDTFNDDIVKTLNTTNTLLTEFKYEFQHIKYRQDEEKKQTEKEIDELKKKTTDNEIDYNLAKQTFELQYGVRDLDGNVKKDKRA